MDWKKAKERLEFYESLYFAMPGGMFALNITIRPLEKRLHDGERTQELYDEIMALE